MLYIAQLLMLYIAQAITRYSYGHDLEQMPQAQPLFDQWIAQLNEFLQSRGRLFDLPMNIPGSAFQCRGLVDN